MPTLPAPEPLFGADLTKNRTFKSAVLFVGHIAVTTALIAWALLADVTVYPIDPAIGNRTEWSPSEIVWAFAVVNGVAFLFHWAAYAISLDDIRAREINNSLYLYAKSAVVDWVRETYGIYISADKAYSLLKGQTISVRFAELGGNAQWLNVYLRNADKFVTHYLNDERVPEDFLYGGRYDPEHTEMSLVVIPDPTPRPAQYELPTRAAQASAAMSRADRKAPNDAYTNAINDALGKKN